VATLAILFTSMHMQREMVMVASFSFITHLAMHAEIDGDVTRTKKKQKAILLTMTTCKRRWVW
jgi:hypothetical protein